MQKSIRQLSPTTHSLTLEEIVPLQSADSSLAFFDDRTVRFFQEYAQRLLANPSFARYPEIAALSFWMRKANLMRILKENTQLTNTGIFASPRGLVFHICPSNVDTMFLYSLALGLLTGNRNVVRISEKLDEQITAFLLKELNALLERPEHTAVAQHLSIIVYGHDDEVNAALSARADVRMIWGGDVTIAAFSDYPTKVTAKDLVFRDRISCAVLNADAFLALASGAREEIAQKFFNDAYSFDQKGCSSPQTLFLIGSEEAAQRCERDLFDRLSQITARSYRRDVYGLACLKFRHAAEDACDGVITALPEKNARLFFAESLVNPLEHHTCGTGYFYLKVLGAVGDLAPLLSCRVQTIAYAGFSEPEVAELVRTTRTCVDRIVPFGKALAFDYIWDSYNLVEELTRKTVSL